jgi:hypothetical protein
MGAFRRLRADEIEIRAAQVAMNKAGNVYASLLLYKDARVDQRLLDETYGPMNWQRSHTIIDGKLYCTVSVWDNEKGLWVSKQDVGTESNTEKEKGQASDSFKRACFNWGIGRELYTAPNIYIKLEDGEWKEKTYGNKTTQQMTQSFYVYHIEYDDDGNITSLIICDKKGNQRFRK